MEREYIFKLRCRDIGEAEQQRQETDNLIARRLIAARKQVVFTTQCCFDPFNFENRIRVKLEGIDSLDYKKSLEMEVAK